MYVYIHTNCSSGQCHVFYVRICIYICVCVYIYIYIYICTDTDTHIKGGTLRSTSPKYTHTHTYIHTYIHTYTHTYANTHDQDSKTYIHTYTHTYANTYDQDSKTEKPARTASPIRRDLKFIEAGKFTIFLT